MPTKSAICRVGYVSMIFKIFIDFCGVLINEANIAMGTTHLYENTKQNDWNERA